MHRFPSSRARRSTRHVAILLALLLTAGIPVLGQGTDQGPLQRGTGSEIEGRPPGQFLAEAGYFDADGALDMRIRYACVKGTGASDDDCQPGRVVGTPTPASQRLVDVYWAANGTVPTEASNTTTLATTGTVTIGSSLLFAGNITRTALAPIADGGLVRWFVKVRLTNADQCAQTVCDRFDPKDTTGEPYYQARVDRSTPGIIVNPIEGAFVGNTTAKQWFIYSPTTLNPPKPIVITVVDNQSGAPIDQARTSIFFNGAASTNNVTNQFTRVPNTPTSVAYVWDPANPSAGSISFQSSADSFFHVDTRDAVGHRFNSASTAGCPGSDQNCNAAVRVVIDTIRPLLNNKTSGLGLPSGQTGLASKGELLRISINATDMGTPPPDNFPTPRQLLRVCATLVPADDAPYNLTAAERVDAAKDCREAPDATPANAATATKGQYLRIPFVATKAGCTGGCHYSEAFVVPSDWDVNGLVTARIVVVDPVGQAVFGNTWGSVFGRGANKLSSNLTVDLLDPVIVQKEPLSGNQTTAFVSTSQVTFRARVTDPGDGDPWQGANTDDSDLLGIDQDTVKVRYKVAGGNEVALGLKPIAEENHFASNPVTLAAEDTLTYFFEAEDFSGNKARLPADGTYTVRVDRKGPVIEEARSHGFLNGATHVFRFNVTDTGVGLDASQARLFWRALGGQYKSVPLVQTPEGFTATIPGQADGTTIEWYAEARDTFGNIGTFPVVDAARSPAKTVIDLTAPKTTIIAPDRVTEPKFEITWSATDDSDAGPGSGADTFDIEFRVGEGGKWYTLVADSRANSFEVCADAQKTYYFRGSATDRAGNVEAFPDTPQTQTFVDAAEACADPPEVTLIAPGSGAIVSGDYTIRWRASSQVAPDGLEYTIELVPSGGQPRTLATIAQADAEQFVWRTASLDPDDPCFEAGTYDLRVIVRDPNDKTGLAEATGIALANGIEDCDDRDADQLPDTWEVGQFGDLAQTADGDPDGDGYANSAEYAAGSDPNDATSIPAGPGGGDGGDETGWNNLYLLVVLAFLATLVVFVVGVSRRW